MANQPTATAFTRTQESWAEHVLEKIEAKIKVREHWLREDGYPESEFADDEELYDLYEDAIFYERYAEEMRKQREYIRVNYLGGVS